jgi:hypothetical protein
VAYEARKVAQLLRIGRFEFHVRNTAITEALQEHMDKKFKKDEEKMCTVEIQTVPTVPERRLSINQT